MRIVIFLTFVLCLRHSVVTTKQFQQGVQRAYSSPGCFDCDLKAKPTAQLPEPDGWFHFFALPIGQGDSHVIQCPDGSLTIFDLGSSNKGTTAGFWDVPQISSFLGDQTKRITNVIITHNHFDHYSFLGEVLGSDKDMSGLQNVYISCTEAQMRTDIQDWLADIGATDKVRTINGGKACGMNGQDCGTMDLCPGSDLTTKILTASWQEQCTTGNINTDSIVLKVNYGSVSMLLMGDFEDFTSDWGENGPQKALVDYYGEELVATVYQVSHHGASSYANKPVMRDILKPKAVFVSGNFWYGYGHPRCIIFDAFINLVPNKTLCKPEATSSEQFYCGEYIDPAVPMEDRVQRQYTCGESSTVSRLVTDNDYAIYTITPTQTTLNLLTFSTDGTRWGFKNQISPRL